MNRSNASAGDGANLLALRSHNTALVLGLLRGAGAEGISRLELAEHTGLTPQAVSKITARLRGEGLAAEAGRRASTGGKPRTVLRLVPEAGHAVGVHLDRDELRAVLVDLDGTVVGERCAPLDLGAGAEALLAGVARAAEELVAEALGPPAARGPGSPGAEGLRTPATEASERSGAPARGERALGERALGGRGPGKQGPGERASGKREPGEQASGEWGPGEREPGEQASGEWGPGERASQGREPAKRASGQREPGKREWASERRVSSAGEGAPLGGAALDAAPTLLGLGVALPGPLDHVRGVLHRVTGFPEWDGYPLRDALERRLGVPVVVDKDTNAAALGLAIGGGGADGGSGGGSFAYLHLGTGLGAGLVFGGGVYRGARTGAGEFGHQVVQLDGPPCTCGARGCIEALCLAAVARGDLAEAARVLGTGAANLAGLLDIDQVLLGGRTVAAAPEAFVQGVGAVLDARARREGGHDGAVPVRLAPGGPRGVAEGAAQLLLAPLFGHGNGG
ncbi:ROK family protein [Streptomyces sp. NPDC048306]|uniref:ROK family protein n=1 Tax=Streptomyces sp. NPDC048306 TaxID=3154502 RepID=UPI0033EDC4EF